MTRQSDGSYHHFGYVIKRIGRRGGWQVIHGSAFRPRYVLCRTLAEAKLVVHDLKSLDRFPFRLKRIPYG